MLQECPVVLRAHFPGGKTGKVQRAPEAIAPARKMMTLGGGSQSWIDAAENHRKVLGQNILEPLTHRKSR